MATTPIELLSNDGKLCVISHATGFFWRTAGKHFLITARHVFSGTDPFTDQLISPAGFVPQVIRVHPSFETSSEAGRGSPIQVIISEATGEPRWKQDPEFDRLRTDIAAIEVDISCPPGFSLATVNSPDNFSPLVTQAGFDCFVLGYANANFGGALTPTWRRATIASEPALPVDGKPMFLLDASTSPGFSGSPVVRRHHGPAPLRSGGSITVHANNVVTTSFVGVYAGRLQNRHYGGELPFAFYGNRIPTIVGQ